MGGRVAAAVAVALLCLSSAAQAQPGASTPAELVTAVELHLPPGITVAELPDKVTVRRGQPLSRRAVRESIDLLWATNLFADVVVRTFKEAGGLRVVFELSGRRCFVSVGVEDDVPEDEPEEDRRRRERLKLSDDEIRQASQLSARQEGRNRSSSVSECPENAEYYPERLRRAVEGIRAAYRDIGYDEADAKVELYEQASGIGVVFKVTEGLPTRVAAVTVAGDPGFGLARTLNASGIQLGEVLRRKTLTAATERLKEALRREQFFRARVGEPVVVREGTQATVSFPIQAGPRFSIHFHGNRTFVDKQLLAVLGYSGVDPLDTTLLARLERRLAAFYRDRGFFDATVSVVETTRPDGAEAILAFDIEEGAPLFVERIDFTGNTEVSSDDLRDVVVGHVRALAPAVGAEAGQVDDPLHLQGRSAGTRVASALLDPENIYSEEAYHNAANALTELYRDRGFLVANVRFASAELGAAKSFRYLGEDVPVSDLHRAVVRFEVDEGPRAVVREITVKGQPSGFDGRQELAGLLQVGQPLNVSLLDQGQTRLVRALNKSGYLFAVVQHVFSTTENDTAAEVIYEVLPGPQVRLGAVLPPSGLTRTEERFVYANLAPDLTPGGLIDPDALFETQKKLIQTGAFRQVQVRLADPDRQSETKDIEIAVRESASYSGEIGGGFSFSEGPRFVIDATAPNWKPPIEGWSGSGINISARGKLNYVGASALQLFPQCSSEAPRAPNGEFIRPSDLVPTTNAQCIAPDEYLGFEGLGGRGNISLQQPRIFALAPLDIGARADLVAERVHRPLYRFSRFAGIVGMDWRVAALNFGDDLLSGAVSTSLQYELEHDRVAITPSLGSVDLNPRLSERYPRGYYTLQNLRGALNADYRDDVTNPRVGAVFTGSAELTHGINATEDDPNRPGYERPLDFDLLTLKTSANFTFYVPITLKKIARGSRELVFAGSLRFGHIFKLNDGAEPVLPKRFFMGGISTMRGFREDALIPEDQREALHQEVDDCTALVSRIGCTSEAVTILSGQEPLSSGGKQFALAKAELRIPAFSSLDLGLFLEAGNLWFEPRDFLSLRAGSLRYVAGAGLRYGTPIGPLAFDFGFNLSPDFDVNEQIFNFHFSIGLF